MPVRRCAVRIPASSAAPVAASHATQISARKSVLARTRPPGSGRYRRSTRWPRRTAAFAVVWRAQPTFGDQGGAVCPAAEELALLGIGPPFLGDRLTSKMDHRADAVQPGSIDFAVVGRPEDRIVVGAGPIGRSGQRQDPIASCLGALTSALPISPPEPVIAMSMRCSQPHRHHRCLTSRQVSTPKAAKRAFTIRGTIKVALSSL